MKIGIAMLLILIPSSFIFCQEDLYEAKNSAKNCFQLFLVNEISIAYKRSISDRSAIRLQVDFNSRAAEEKRYSEYLSVPNSSIRETTNFSNYQNYSFFLDYLIQHKYSNNFLFLYGIGPLFKHEYFHGKNKDMYNKISERYFTNWSAGICLVTGIDVPVYSFFSLNAEYRLQVFHICERINYNFSKLDGWKYEIDGIRIGLSFHF
ncbi:MAG: hypothetical protein JXR46_15625 [Calditrichaceae bacterium]|nr:hypothetical protein [Calditrichaceae bacterium]MBN2710474.1 hypothetical protein [Calditrichaceae bacterium]RQV93592.1 MAG: hypothetical protein EH224_12010 [Calditrichota bacterium]